jgi:hypothetical protein
MQGDGGGIGDHLGAIHQHGHLPLAGQAEQGELAQARGDLDHAVVEALGRQHQPHLLTEGRMAELVKLHAPGLGARRQSSQQQLMGCPLRP